jgi:protoporphyrinogen IX oxidase
MIIALKVLHIAALSIWCMGLFSMPGLLAAGGRLHDPSETDRSHRLTRLVFIQVMSPAAVVAIAAGTGLLLYGGVFAPWMFAKLGAVSALVLIHLLAGRLATATRLGASYGRVRQTLATLATTIVVTTILWLVLAKPIIDLSALPDWARQPGGLQSLLDTIRPMP